MYVYFLQLFVDGGGHEVRERGALDPQVILKVQRTSSPRWQTTFPSRRLTNL